MQSNNRGTARDDNAKQRVSELIQEIHGMGADSLLKENDDQLCARLVRKYEVRSGSDKMDGSDDPLLHRSLAEAARENVVRRKANFFGGLPTQPEKAVARKRVAS
jgi:hypothetical protein